MIRKLLSRYLLKMPNLMPIQPSPSDPERRRRLLLDPDVVGGDTVRLEDEDKEVLSRLEGAVSLETVKLTYQVRYTVQLPAYVTITN